MAARTAKGRRRGGRYWSAAVTRTSNALDLEARVFRQRDPRRIALALERSAERSRRRKGTPYQSAMSMLAAAPVRPGLRRPREEARAPVSPAVLLRVVALGCGARDLFTILHVSDLASRLTASGPHPTVVDANGADFRAREGIIPGAVLLSGYKTYNVAKELPPAKDTPLVFYCADTH